MNVLENIVEHKRREVERLAAEYGIEAMRNAASASAVPQDFLAGIRGGISIIAEVKRRSPSRGELLEGGDVVGLSRTYREHGARAVSVLTDERFFGGTADDLKVVKEETGLPVLRKDFVIDPLQVYESRVIGADAILLIAAILEDERLRELSGLASELGLAGLVEVHSRKELERVLRLGVDFVGINNRNLKTFEVRLETSIELVEEVPRGVSVVAESGIREAGDIARLARAGFRVFLIGEALVASGDPGSTLEELVRGAETAVCEGAHDR